MQHDQAEIDSDFASATTAVAAMTGAEIDMQIRTAKKYPRNLAAVRKRATEMATLDEDVAETCWYTLERGKGQDRKVIVGPSIRLAEICASAWGNIRFGARIIDEAEASVTAQGYCHDLETNVMVMQEVRRGIVTRNGERYGNDMVLQTMNAASSIAVRNAVFKVLSQAFVNSIMFDAQKYAAGDDKNLPEKRARVLERLAIQGVSQGRVLAKVGRASVAEITKDDVQTLIGVGTAIRDGESTVDESFPVSNAPEAGKGQFGFKKEASPPPPPPSPLKEPDEPTKPTNPKKQKQGSLLEVPPAASPSPPAAEPVPEERDVEGEGEQEQLIEDAPAEEDEDAKRVRLTHACIAQWRSRRPHLDDKQAANCVAASLWNSFERKRLHDVEPRILAMLLDLLQNQKEFNFEPLEEVAMKGAKR